MRTVKILCGGYGAPRPNGKGKKLILAGQTVSVEDAEAERLIALGYASAVVATGKSAGFDPEASENAPGKEIAAETAEAHDLDEETLNAMTNAQLFDLAESLGLDPKPKQKKAYYVDLIAAGTAPLCVGGFEDAEDGVELPNLKAEDPVE